MARQTRALECAGATGYASTSEPAGEVEVQAVWHSPGEAFRGRRSACAGPVGWPGGGAEYRADDFESALDAACPEGVDVYFDNTAGAISDAVMRRLNVGARVVICGTASIASWDPPPQGPRIERQLLVTRARMQGFLIVDHVQRYPEALRELEGWMRSGQ